MNNSEAHFYLEELQRMMTQHRDIFTEEFVCANGMAIQALEAQEQRWTPVSERLPEDSYGCIVAYHGFMMTPSGEKEYDAVYYETVGFDGQGWNNANGENIDNLIDVTAWMPLPKPWKGR